jgi:uncharacterized protein YndB with AHSA1/START domain
MDRSTSNSKIIHADKSKVYQAFSESKALEFWLAPYGMTGKIHNFNFKTGGGYEMSLFYKDAENEGKSGGNEDRFSTTYTEIIPQEKIVQTIKFKSDNNDFQGEMTMEVYLEEVHENSTKVSIIFKNIPPGINPDDNEDGTEQSLEKLAKYLEAN